MASASQYVKHADDSTCTPDDNTSSPDDGQGEDPMYVTLVSNDGHEFIIKREDAMKSGTIKSMLAYPGHFSEHKKNKVNFRDMSSRILQHICVYLTYKGHYSNFVTEIPSYPIDRHNARELLMAANFLDC